MEGSIEPVSLMMKETGEDDVERTRMRRIFYCLQHKSFTEFLRSLPLLCYTTTQIFKG